MHIIIDNKLFSLIGYNNSLVIVSIETLIKIRGKVVIKNKIRSS